jgi:sulfide:quinone oxidoreductase
MTAKIVPLTENLSVASQIGLDDIARIGAAGFRTIINNRPDGDEPGQLSSADAGRAAAAAGLHYVYLPITAATLSRAEIDEFDRLLSSATGPVLAHCRSGTRCCLVWAATELVNRRQPAAALIRDAAGRGFDIAALTRFA